jgi:hypothetical protein
MMGRMFAACSVIEPLKDLNFPAESFNLFASIYQRSSYIYMYIAPTFAVIDFVGSTCKAKARTRNFLLGNPIVESL